MNAFIQLILFSYLMSLAVVNAQDKFHKFGNREFYVEPEFMFNWFDAELECTRKNMSLLTVETSQKSLEVKNLLKNVFQNQNIPKLYIGAHDLGQLRKFVWIPLGQAFTFTNWAQNEPNNYKGDERCVHIGWYGNDLWNDETCSVKYGFICEDCPY